MHPVPMISGSKSMPYVKEDGGLYNVGFLVRRDGTYEMYEKVHVTPDEIKSWGLSGGKLYFMISPFSLFGFPVNRNFLRVFL